VKDSTEGDGLMAGHPVDRAQRVALDHLLDNDPAQLAEREVALVVGDAADTRDALLDLVAAGLAHERDGFYWPTRAAVAFARLRAEDA
jgi:hypothetical protein